MQGTYEQCQQISNARMCANCQHGSLLLVRHVHGSAADSTWEVYCPGCGETERFLKPESLTTRWRRDPEGVPITVANKLQRKYGGGPMSEQALTTITKQEMTERINGARWMHQLTPQQVGTLAEVAVRYGYDPLMGEVTVYEGKIYVTLDGALRDAKRVPNFQGIQTTPLTQQEREARGIRQPIAYKAELYRADWRVPAVGIGVADPQNPFRNNPVERQQPHALAEARAIRRAVRLAREAPNGIIRDNERTIDAETGEIVEATVRELPADEPAPATSDPFEQATDQEGNRGGEVEPERFVCADCGKLILMHTDKSGRQWTAEDIKGSSAQYYGRPLCWACSAEAKLKKEGQRAGHPAQG